jgi:hypothetical protein
MVTRGKEQGGHADPGKIEMNFLFSQIVFVTVKLKSSLRTGSEAADCTWAGVVARGTGPY